MSLSNLYKARQKPAAHELPAHRPSLNLCGPETITGTVREIVAGQPMDKVRLWNDAQDRWHYIDSEGAIIIAGHLRDNDRIAVVTEKVRGRWTIGDIKDA